MSSSSAQKDAKREMRRAAIQAREDFAFNLGDLDATSEAERKRWEINLKQGGLGPDSQSWINIMHNLSVSKAKAFEEMQGSARADLQKAYDTHRDLGYKGSFEDYIRMEYKDAYERGAKREKAELPERPEKSEAQIRIDEEEARFRPFASPPSWFNEV